jgi:hypothetical protein
MNNFNDTNLKKGNSDKNKSFSSESEFNLDNEMRIIICWNCHTQVAIGYHWKKVICPGCGMLNSIPKMKEKSMRPNIDLNFDSANVVPYLVIVCPFCEYSMKTKRESEYLTCTRCKNTVIIIKAEQNPIELMEWKVKHLNQLSQLSQSNKVEKIQTFNPYSSENDDKYRLEPGFEKEIIENYNLLKKMDSSNRPKEANVNRRQAQYTNKFQVYHPLIETTQEISENIRNKNFNNINKFPKN